MATITDERLVKEVAVILDEYLADIPPHDARILPIIMHLETTLVEKGIQTTGQGAEILKSLQDIIKKIVNDFGTINTK